MYSTFGILIFAIAVIRIFSEFRGSSWFGPYVPLFTAIVLIYIPLIYNSIKKERIEYIDKNIKNLISSFKWFFISLVLILPLFLIAGHFWEIKVFDASFMPRMIPGLGLIILDQLFLVAIPEEFFFRGWFQSRLNNLFKPKWNIFGVRIGYSWLITALIFAAAHSIISYQWWHFAIFFPALLFGWLREKTGSITASSLWHCVANIAVYWIGISYI